jgi:Sulfotransferase family
VPEPVFVLSPIRAGSTLLRVLLNSHSQIRAPHEMHLRTLHVTPAREFSADVMADLGLDNDELEHLLWDRILHLELQRSGKSVIVDKTPANVLIWKRLRRAWPQAKYLVLLRHPAAIVESVMSRRTDGDLEAAVAEIAGYARGIDAAREALPCLTISYEGLTDDPAAVTRRVCAHLGVDWEPTMLDYGRFDHGAFRPFAGDWSDNIRSGTIQPARRPSANAPDDERIQAIAERWGYSRTKARSGQLP